jgi:hypothetical protein
MAINRACQEQLRAIHGVGPKTVDFVCGLVGSDFIAVDRHIRAVSGAMAADYAFLQSVISYATGRHFDASIWTYYQSEDRPTVADHFTAAV